MKSAATLIVFILFSFNLLSQQVDNEQLLDLMQGQRYTEAAALIKLSYPGEIKDAKVISRLAYYNFMSGNLVEAEQNYQRLLDRDSSDKSVLFNMAALNNKRSNIIKSKFYYQKVLQIDSTNFFVFKQLATLSELSGDEENQGRYLKKANYLNPKEADVAYDYSNLLRKQEKIIQADSVIQTALEADTLNLQLIQAKIGTSFKLKKYLLVSAMAKKALEMGDNSAQTINLLGQSLYFLQKYQKCIDIYNILEQQDKGNESTFYYTALCHRRLNNIQKSIEYMNKSIADGISANITVYYNELALDYETLKNYKKSISSYKKAAEYKQKNIYNYNIARLYDAYLADKTNARKYYSIYIKNYKSTVSEKELHEYAVKRIKELKITSPSTSPHTSR